MSHDSRIKEQVKFHMRQQKVTQVQLAKKWGIDQSSVAAVVGKTRAINERFEQLLDELGLELVVQKKIDH